MLNTSEDLETLEDLTCLSRHVYVRSAGCRENRRNHTHHRTQSYTIGDAIDIAVQRNHTERQNPKSTSKDKGGTKEINHARKLKNKGNETGRVDTQNS